MQNVLATLFSQYNVVSNNISLIDKINIIKDTFSISEDNIQLFFIGILYDFIKTQPQYYFNRNVKDEVFYNLDNLFLEDNEKFSNAFFEHQNNFFSAINLYNHILETYNEFDDVTFAESTKIKIYYLPIITQLMEFCLNHLYRFILYVSDDFITDKNYKDQNKLGALKNSLFDIASGCTLGIIQVLTNNNIINEKYILSIDENTTQEYVKLFLHNENIRVKTFSKDMVGTTQLYLHIDIKNINDKNQIIHLLILIGKILYVVFPQFERYFIKYTHPYSIGGMISFENSQLYKMSQEESVIKLDDYLSKESAILIPDIQDTNLDNRSYKFQIFPKISNREWEVIQIKDISIDGTKRFDAKIIVEDESISKEAVEAILFQAVKQIRIIENKYNPITKIKYGKVEADVVCMSIFFKSTKRKPYALLKSNEDFICTVNYYKSKSVPRIQLGFQDNYHFEQLKKFDIYWNVNFIKE